MKNYLNTNIGQSELPHPAVPPMAMHRAMRTAICWVAVLASAMGVTMAAAENNSNLVLQTPIIEGVGISSLVVNQSTKAEVIERYGDAFKLISHGKYSDEIKYNDLGLSFYYCYGAQVQTIFAIEINAPYQGKTSKGIVLGGNILQDVFDLYGKADPSFTIERNSCSFEYRGVIFGTDCKQGEGVYERGEIAEKIRKRKITIISIVTPDIDGNACDLDE